jgi:hypothetical protein
MKRTNNKPMPAKDKTYNVYHGTKQIGQVTAPDAGEAYRQAKDHHKIPLAVIGRKEEQAS